jgi:outer membrane protein OmpA-like peptidoglycan-associated protein
MTTHVSPVCTRVGPHADAPAPRHGGVSGGARPRRPSVTRQASRGLLPLRWQTRDRGGRRGRPRLVVALVVIAAGILAVAGPGEAPPKQRLDLTGRQDLTPGDIVRGLVPGPTHGDSAAGPAGRPSVALTVEFAFNAADILPQAAHTLQAVAEALQAPELAGARLQIEGHTDSVGSDPYNLRLSERRARSVKQYLVRQYRLAPERLLAVGRGEPEPIAENATPEGRQKNRRVELVNLQPQEARTRKEGTIFWQPPGPSEPGGARPHDPPAPSPGPRLKDLFPRLRPYLPEGHE